MISEKDRPILGYLQNVELNLHKEDNGFDLTFTFGSNNYFNETVITKSLVMLDKGILDSTSSTEVTWKDGCNPTIKKQKKKKKGKKVTVESECESFFNIFKSLSQPDETAVKPKIPAEDDDEEDGGEEELQEKLADDLEVAEMIKEDLIPLALEYYLGVIEKETPEEDEEGEEGEGSGDDDDDDVPKKKKGKKGKKSQMPLGPDGKPQECKQQ